MKRKKIENPKLQTMLTSGDQSDMIIYTSKDGCANVALMTREGRVWLTQKQMAELFGTSVPSISMNIAKILNDRELDSDSVIKQFLTTASDGKTYDTLYYSLEMILAVGYKVRGVRGIQFRQWATRCA